MVKSNIEEFIQIRKRFQASRKQFGEVFIGKSGVSVTNYERGKTEIPESVMMLARAWNTYLDAIKGKQKCKR